MSADPAGPREEVGGEAARWEVDLHTHTSASHDCLVDPADLVARGRELGLDRIAVTDHNEIEGALDARQRDAELVIVGEEVRTAEGLDLIGLFIHRHIPPGWPFRDVAQAIRMQGGLVYLPHPFDGHRGADPAFLEEVVDQVDAVEGFNARCHSRRRNERAEAWARERDLAVGAGSDAHLLAELGRARVCLPPFRGPEGFLESLHRGEIRGRASGRWVHLGSSWAKLYKKLF